MSIRLIDTHTLHMKVFLGSKIPKYVALSHTWMEDEEVDFREMIALSTDSAHPALHKSGFGKIRRTCDLAKDHDIGYAWVDTCCIDKSSSAELSEAINSMFKWYQNAVFCLAFLSDMPPSIDVQYEMRNCRWWLRGWTLQELIAPKDLWFYDRNWNRIGTRYTLKHLINAMTRIDEAVLDDCETRHEVPLARRMSWASKRVTTREEDTAYCLLGIFDVNIPLIYGEGSKAFLRLQEEIIKRSNDLSIFWHHPFADQSEPESYEVEVPMRQSDPEAVILDPSGKKRASLPKLRHKDPLYFGAFAGSPKEFSTCGDILRLNDSIQEFSLTNKGINFHKATLYHRRIPNESGYRPCYLLFLGHKGGSSFSNTQCALALLKVGPGRYVSVYQSVSTDIRSLCRTLRTIGEHAFRIEVGHCDGVEPDGFQPMIEYPGPQDYWDAAHQQFLNPEKHFDGHLKIKLGIYTGHLFKSNNCQVVECYVACGVGRGRNIRVNSAHSANSANSANLEPWVRLLSPATKQRLSDESKYWWNKGVIWGSMNNAQIGYANWLPDAMHRDQLSSDDLVIGAHVKKVYDGEFPSYRLVLEFKALHRYQPKKPHKTKSEPKQDWTGGDGHKKVLVGHK